MLDEADRMLDMGFLPDIRRVLRHLPAKAADALLLRDHAGADRRAGARDAEEPGHHEPRAQGGAGGRHHAGGLSGRRRSSRAALLRRRCCSAATSKSVLVFTRTKHRANRLAEFLERAARRLRAHPRQPQQAQRTEALAGFKAGRFRVLVATDIAARGIDVEALSHVVNFDVPGSPDDYIHRVGRTARAEATGDAFTFVAPDEEDDLRAIERAIGKRLPRVTVPGFDYARRTAERLEVPLRDRLAAMRLHKANDRARSRAKGPRHVQKGGGGPERPSDKPRSPHQGPRHRSRRFQPGR